MDDDLTESERIGYGNDFVTKFNDDYLSKLYGGFITENDDLNIAKNAISYTNGNYHFFSKSFFILCIPYFFLL